MYTEQIYKEMGIIEFHPFRIEDKKMIDGFFRIHHYEQIDCTFNTLFIWQKAHDTSWAVQDNILFIHCGNIVTVLAAICQGRRGIQAWP